MKKYILTALLVLFLALPASAEIRWTYSKQEPQIQRLQGGILYPYQPEQVEVSTENGTETMWRFKLLKFEGSQEDIEAAFDAVNTASINAQAANAVDVQKLSPKQNGWLQKIPGIANSTVVRLEKDLAPEQKKALIEHYPVWSGDGQNCVKNQVLRYRSGLFKVLQSHTSQADWTPTAAESLFTEVAPPNVIPEWVQPEGSHDAHNTGDQVTFEGHIWESTIDANVWSPTAYPQGWKDLGAIQ